MKNVTNLTDEQCQELFLEWFNDFLTVAKFAEYHGFTVEHADNVISYGRYVHNLMVSGMKPSDRAQALTWYIEGIDLSTIAQHYGIDREAMSSILNNQ